MVKRVARDAPGAAPAGGGEEPSIAGPVDAKQVSQEEDVTEEQMEADLIKAGDSNDIEQVTESLRADDEAPKRRARVTMITPAQTEAVAAALRPTWRRLAAKLGYKPDEVQYFATEQPDDARAAAQMLALWFDSDEDASVENLLYIMEGLELTEACEALRPPEK